VSEYCVKNFLLRGGCPSLWPLLRRVVVHVAGARDVDASRVPRPSPSCCCCCYRRSDVSRWLGTCGVMVVAVLVVIGYTKLFCGPRDIFNVSWALFRVPGCRYYCWRSISLRRRRVVFITEPNDAYICVVWTLCWFLALLLPRSGTLGVL